MIPRGTVLLGSSIRARVLIGGKSAAAHETAEHVQFVQL